MNIKPQKHNLRIQIDEKITLAMFMECKTLEISWVLMLKH